MPTTFDKDCLTLFQTSVLISKMDNLLCLSYCTLQKKQPPPVEAEPGEFQAPTLFKTSDYFNPILKEKSLHSEGITMQLEVEIDEQESQESEK